jgi:hypothetical protein
MSNQDVYTYFLCSVQIRWWPMTVKQLVQLTLDRNICCTEPDFTPLSCSEHNQGECIFTSYVSSSITCNMAWYNQYKWSTRITVRFWLRRRLQHKFYSVYKCSNKLSEQWHWLKLSKFIIHSSIISSTTLGESLPPQVSSEKTLWGYFLVSKQ